MTTVQSMIQIFNSFVEDESQEFLALSDYTLVRNDGGHVLLVSSEMDAVARLRLAGTMSEFGDKERFYEVDHSPIALVVKQILQSFGFDAERYNLEQIATTCFDSDGNRCVSMKTFWIMVIRSIKK